MSVDRRSIGVPAIPTPSPVAATTTALVSPPPLPATLGPMAPLQWLGAPNLATPAQSAAAVRARQIELERVKDRVFAAGGESPRDLTAYLKRFTVLGELPLAWVFPGQSVADVRAAVSVDHGTVHIAPSDVALTALRSGRDSGGLTGPDDVAHGIGVIAALSTKDAGAPVGFYVQTLVNSRDEGRFDHLDFAVVNPTAGSALGVGKELTGLADRLASLSGSVQSRLKTAWVGRYYWAQKGYDFASPSERDRVVACFHRFVTHMHIDEATLFIEPPGEPRRPFSWDALQHSWDIAYVGSTLGPVEVPGLVANAQTKAVSAAVGKAFYLGDWGNPVLGQNGADIFVRNWLGVRQRS